MAEFAPSFEDAWSRFQALASVQLADEDDDVSRGRAQMLGFLIRVEDRAVRRHAAAVIERIASIPGIEPLPEEHWHVTVKLAGFQVIKRTNDDDILREEVGRLSREAGDIIRRHGAFEAQIGKPNGFPDAVVLEVEDAGRTRELNEALAAHDLIAGYPFDGDHYLPHMTIARFSSSEGLSELKSALTELRAQGPGPTLAVGRVDFVKAWLTGGEPDIGTLAGYRLAAS